jgi:thymidine phosphorylase
MVTLGNACGVRTHALLTSMDAPLGRAAGNWLEVREAVACLEPRPEPGIDDVRKLVLACAATLLLESGKTDTSEYGTELAEDCLTSGEPRQKFDQMLAAQGADLEAFRRKLGQEATAPAVLELKADLSGWVAGCDARAVGEIVRDLGGGRLTQGAVIHPEVGVDRMLKPGERVIANSTLARVHAQTSDEAEAAANRLRAAFMIVQARSEVPPQKLICGQISAAPLPPRRTRILPVPTAAFP